MRIVLGAMLLLVACGSSDDLQGSNRSSPASEPERSTTADADGGASAPPDAESPNTPAAPSTSTPPSAPPAAVADPFTLDPNAATLTGVELQAYVDSKDTGADGTLVGTFDVFARSRDCGSPCGPWKAPSADTLVPGSSPNNPQPTPQKGDVYAFRKDLVFLARVPGATSVSAGTGSFGILCETTLPQDGLALERDCRPSPWFRFTGPRAASPKNLWDTPATSTFFYFPGELYFGNQAMASGTSTIRFRGHAYRDGTVQLVTDVGQADTGAGMHQLAIVGHLDGI